MKITVGIGATRANSIEAAVRSICAQTWSDWELLIVGQGSELALRAVGERLGAGDPRVKYIHLDQMGLSRAHNEVICQAQGEVIAFTDDDCEADPEWLAVIAECMAADPSVGVVGGALVCPPAPQLALSTCPSMTPAESLYDPAVHRGGPPPGCDWVGANVAVRAAVVTQVGLFDPFLGPGALFVAAEDTDYKLRLEAAGIRTRATPRAVVRHTYGRRVGLRAVARLSRAYARGGGALAGKLTVAGDPRGAAWVQVMQRQIWRDLLQPVRAVAAISRLRHFTRAYREVVAGFVVDRQTGCLAPRPSLASAARTTSAGPTTSAAQTTSAAPRTDGALTTNRCGRERAEGATHRSGAIGDRGAR